MTDIPLEMESDLNQTFRDYTIGELQDAALELLVLDVENFGEKSALALDKTHQKLSSEACNSVEEASNCNGQAIFLMLSTGIDLICTAISALDRFAFMAEVEDFGGE